MPKVFYRYNPSTFQYEPVYSSGKHVVNRVFLYVLFGLMAAAPAAYWYTQNHPSIREQHLLANNEKLSEQWEDLKSEIDAAYQQLDSLSKKDDLYYRVLLDLPALDASERQAGVGGADRLLDETGRYEVIRTNYERLEKLKRQLDVAQQSFDQLHEVTQTKSRMMRSRPAIQPIDKEQLTVLHLTFGMRLHPIFKEMMDHKGLDFTASTGTPVYATADGRVSNAYFSASYGNVVFIDHGFSYETRYAHLQKFSVEPGNFVKRGDIIGYVGNTGISAAPHLHYEVFFRGIAVNPIHFFQRDLSQQEYQKIIRSSGP